MDVFAPPEITSALIHSGPGAGSLIEASGAWQRLAVELENSVAGYASTLSSLIESWDGPSSMAMLQAVQPYLIWLRETAQQAQQLAAATQTAATAHSAVRAGVVQPSVVTANRKRLAQLLASNLFGTNTAAIAMTENEYLTMWANNSAAMARYQTASTQATNSLSQFNSPVSTTNPNGQAAQANAVSTAAGTSAGSVGSKVQAAVSNLQAAPAVNANAIPIFGSGGDPNGGWFGYASTWGNQFISSGFPVNMLSYLAQNTSAQALQGVGSDIGAGLSEGEGALSASLTRLAGAISTAGPGSAAAGAMGAAVTVGKLSAPPAVVGLLPATPTPVTLTSAASPLPASSGISGMPMMPMMPMMPATNSAGSGWRKRKQKNLEEFEYEEKTPKKVVQRPPSVG
jgi:PPE-repeat protein